MSRNKSCNENGDFGESVPRTLAKDHKWKIWQFWQGNLSEYKKFNKNAKNN